MGRELSDVVKQALRDIYYNERTGRGKEAFASLERASAEGDGDATCVLARCLCGYQYVWKGHGFPEDDARAQKLLRLTVEQGSALGVLVALRSGELSRVREKKMPFASLQEAFDIVLEQARGGEAFCQYVIGNSYFWWDFLRIQNRSKDSFPSQEAYREFMSENIAKCEDWFWKALRGGVYFAANNLNQFYTKGDGDYIAPRPEKAADLFKIGAECGHPLHQEIYAGQLEKQGRNEEALRWYKEAAEGGNPGSWYYVGRYYYEGIGTEKDENYAVSCFEREMPSMGSYNMLGRAYVQGKGVVQDCKKGYEYLTKAYEMGNKWGCVYLGQCCFYGWGTAQDYNRARGYLEQITWKNDEKNYMLGCIYGRGLGVEQDIPKAVELLKSAPGHAGAREELGHYKKTFFGKWVRR